MAGNGTTIRNEQLRGPLSADSSVFFGECHTASDVADKVVTAPGYTPSEGKILIVKFDQDVRCFDVTTQTWVNLTMNVNGTGALYMETYSYPLEGNEGNVRYYELLETGNVFYAAFQYYELSAEDKGYRLMWATGILNMFFNLFDCLNALKSNLDDLEQPAPIFYGITNTAEATATKVVTLINPSDGFVNGSFLLLHFTYAVPTGNGNAISVDGVSYGLTYHQYGVISSGVINAGDKVLLYCHNYVAHIVAIDRWGADIQGKQDALVTSGANQNIKTINSNSLLGSGDITLLPTHTLHTTAIATAGSTTTVTCAANERAFHIVKVNAANCTLWINILNGWDNTIYVYGSQNVNIIFKINGVQATTIFERHDQFAGLTAILSKAGAMKFVVEVVDNKAFVDVDAMDSLTPSV